jgi:hypothetical protein
MQVACTILIVTAASTAGALSSADSSAFAVEML